MSTTLLITAAVMGLAGIPHCAAMCSATCMALTHHRGLTRQTTTGGGAGWAMAGWQLGRLLSYSVAGALAASSVSVLSTMAASLPLLRPLWVMLQTSALGFGLWLLWFGRWPAWFESATQGHARLMRSAVSAAMPAPFASDTVALQVACRSATPGPATAVAVHWYHPREPVARAAIFGSLWALMPCGLLQSALLVAALASSAGEGAVIMLAFGLASVAGPMVGPALLLRLGFGRPGAPAWATRLAGLVLGASAGWALGRGLWQQVLDWCV